MCEQDTGESTLFKRVLEILSIILGIGFLLFSWWMITKYVTVDPKQWSMFYNSKLPVMLTNPIAVLMVVVGLDLAYPGHAIRSILDVKKESLWQEKGVAAFFLASMGYIIYLAVHGGF